jgi:hypothetical protein
MSNVCIHCRKQEFTMPLPSNGRIFWLHYSSLQQVYHNIKHNYNQAPKQQSLKMLSIWNIPQIEDNVQYISIHYYSMDLMAME